MILVTQAGPSSDQAGDGTCSTKRNVRSLSEDTKQRDASIDPDFHSSEWTLVRNKRNNRMKGDKDRKISKFDFGTKSR